MNYLNHSQSARKYVGSILTITALVIVFSAFAPTPAHAQSFPFSPFGGGRSNPLNILNPANVFGGGNNGGGGIYASPRGQTIPPRQEPPRQPPYQPPQQPPYRPPYQPPYQSGCSYSCYSSFQGPQYYHVPPQIPPYPQPRPYPVPYPVPRPYPVYEPYPYPQPVYYPQPQPVYYPQPQPVYYPQPQPIIISQPQPIYIPQPQPIIISQPQPIIITQPTYPLYQNRLGLSCSPDASTVMNNRFVTWNAYVVGGQAPYTYVWSGTDYPSSGNQSSIYVYYNEYGAKSMNLTVQSADGQVATSFCGSVTIIDP